MSELIDREATVKQICKIGEMVGGHDRDVVISIALFVQDDKTAFPTEERPRGEWIDKKDSLQTFCSNCDRAIPYSDEYDFSDFILCPYCGSDNRPRKDVAE